MYGALSGENRPAGTGGPFYTADKHTVFYTSQTRPPARFAPGAWLSLGHTPERKPSITFLKVTLLFWNFSHMISFGIMKLHKTNRIYSYKDWECACHGKENCRFARGWNWSGSRQRKYQGIGAGRTEIWAHVPLLCYNRRCRRSGGLRRCPASAGL